MIAPYARTLAHRIVTEKPDVARLVFEMMSFRKSVDERYGMTLRQYELLCFIRDYYERNDFAPSYDEMKEALGLHSKSGISRLVNALEERGHISRLPNRARSIILEGTA